MVASVNSPLTDGTSPVSHNEVVSVTEGPQISRSSLKKARKSLVLEGVGCSRAAATAASSIPHSWPQVLIGRCSAPSSRQHFKVDLSCLKAALSGVVCTCRLTVPIGPLHPQALFLPLAHPRGLETGPRGELLSRLSWI